MRAKTVIAAGALTLVAMVGFLFSPRVPHGEENLHCVSVTDFGAMHLHKNCDSEEFQYVAAHPSLLLSERRYRQSRPLYAVLGWTFSRPFHWLGLQSIASRVVGGAQQSDPKGRTSAEYFPEYAGFVVLNFVLLLGAVLLFLKLSEAGRLFDPLIVLPLALVVVNEVTKAFFWTPHTQIFNVFVPLASVALYRWMLTRSRELTSLHITLLGLAIGVAGLAYGAFAITAVGAALCVAVAGGDRSTWIRLMKSVLLIVAFLVPALLWIASIKYTTGSFYSLEIDLNRDFVWIADVLMKRGITGFLWMFLIQTEAYGETIRSVFPFPIVVLGVLSALLASHNHFRETISSSSALVKAIALYAAPCFVFFWLLGFYYSRLTWSLVPPMALLIAIETRSIDVSLANRGKAFLRGGLMIVTLGYLAYWYLTPGPWS